MIVAAGEAKISTDEEIAVRIRGSGKNYARNAVATAIEARCQGVNIRAFDVADAVNKAHGIDQGMRRSVPANFHSVKVIRKIVAGFAGIVRRRIQGSSDGEISPTLFSRSPLGDVLHYGAFCFL